VNRPVTIDASVFVSALSSAEPHNQESDHFLQRLSDHPRPVILPTLVKPEIAGPVIHRTGRDEFAREAAELTFLVGDVIFVDLDARLADEAADIALVASGLRGSDAVYAATARLNALRA
jgi:predicted nucleic acid-binding protein